MMYLIALSLVVGFCMGLAFFALLSISEGSDEEESSSKEEGYYQNLICR
ncbi:MAG TPA: hypothetical protein VNM22_22840 [Candidatus Limnocylindrales bacterium]|nr:hypothetical protein [Candidatus Limnocylindrales bacterium]